MIKSKINKITIITPNYNQGEYILENLNSVSNQKGNFEIEHIIIDAISLDDSKDIIEKFKSVNIRYKKIILYEKDTGPAEAINKGLKLATGGIVCWLNADDYYYADNTLLKVINLFEANENIDVITGNGYYYKENNNIYEEINVKLGDINYEKILKRCTILQPSTFWRQNNLRLSEKLKYTFDWQLWLDMHKNSLNFVQVNDFYSVYRWHASSLTYQDNSKRKYEIYQFAINNKSGYLQMNWCFVVYLLYKYSEITKIKLIKKIARIANEIICIVSFGLIYST
jgi:glycosyltransferase involved in cell wall biosynthesis